jgi:hypothetical protein
MSKVEWDSLSSYDHSDIHSMIPSRSFVFGCPKESLTNQLQTIPKFESHFPLAECGIPKRYRDRRRDRKYHRSMARIQRQDLCVEVFPVLDQVADGSSTGNSVMLSKSEGSGNGENSQESTLHRIHKSASALIRRRPRIKMIANDDPESRRYWLMVTAILDLFVELHRDTERELYVETLDVSAMSLVLR